MFALSIMRATTCRYACPNAYCGPFRRCRFRGTSTNAQELPRFLVLHGSADAVAHVPSGFVRAEAHVAVNLPGADALLAGRHEVDDAEPLPQVHICVLEDRPDEVREAVGTALPAVRAFPAVLHGLEGIDVRAATARAMDAVRPAVCDKNAPTPVVTLRG
jgi:hypothetical protein